MGYGQGKSMRPSRSAGARKFVLVIALRLGTLWDWITTFIGILIILLLGNPNGYSVITMAIATSIALIGTLIIAALAAATRPIWKRRQGNSTETLSVLLLRGIWLLAIAMDLWTSLTCNAWFIASQRPQNTLALANLLQSLRPGQLIIVLFVTLITGVSAILSSSLRNQDIDRLLE